MLLFALYKFNYNITWKGFFACNGNTYTITLENNNTCTCVFREIYSCLGAVNALNYIAFFIWRIRNCGIQKTK